MSIWHEIRDKEDVSLSDDGKSIEVLFDGDDNGNIYVEIPLEFIAPLHKPDVELPSDVEIVKYIEALEDEQAHDMEYSYTTGRNDGFLLGAKWMKDKIL